MNSLVVSLAAAAAALSVGVAEAKSPDRLALVQSADVSAVTPFSTDATGLMLKTHYEHWGRHHWRGHPVLIGRGYGHDRYRHDNGWHRGWDHGRGHGHWRR